MKWKIVADSSCDLRPHMMEEEGIGFGVAPLKIIVGDTEYVDDENLDLPKMLEHMKQHKGASSSACPSPDEFLSEFEEGDNIIAIIMTSALSGTYNCAVNAQKLAKERWPEKNIHVIDTRSTATTMVMMIKKVKELIKSGLSFQEVCDAADAYLKTIGFLFALGSYDNLIKSGRMSKIAGIVATTLNIRAVATATSEGTIEVIEKPRGESGAIKKIIALMKAKGTVGDKPVLITHCFNENGANTLKAAIEQEFSGVDVEIYHARGLVSYYSNIGALLLSF